jgi:UDP-N-acetylmuramoyl-L-alanyl-D-glutamate--2,6-diaminopimelate ligase
LAELLAGIVPVPAGSLGEIGIGGISVDSRSVRPGDLFVAVSGARADGHVYLADAARAASARYTWPSARAPETATNRSPGRTERESTLIPPIPISPREPAGTGTIPARSSANLTAPPCRRRSSAAAPP